MAGVLGRFVGVRVGARWSPRLIASRVFSNIRAAEPDIQIPGYPAEREALHVAVWADLNNPQKGVQHVLRQAQIGEADELRPMTLAGPFKLPNSVTFMISKEHCLPIGSRKYMDHKHLSPFVERELFKHLRRAQEPLWWYVVPTAALVGRTTAVVRNACRRKLAVALRLALGSMGYDETGRRMGSPAPLAVSTAEDTGQNDQHQLAEGTERKDNAGLSDDHIHGTLTALIREPFEILAADMEQLEEYMVNVLKRFQELKERKPKGPRIRPRSPRT
jgi:hypothetical protein